MLLSFRSHPLSLFLPPSLPGMIRVDKRRSFGSHAIFASVHGCIGEPVGGPIVLAESVTDFHVLDLAGEMLGFLVKRAQIGMADLINAFHLANHEFGIADDFEGLDPVLDGISESGQKPVVLGVVVGAMAEVLAEFGDLFPARILDYNSVAGGTGIATGAAIDVGSVDRQSHTKSLQGKAGT
jgi:hypothetical protein